MKNIGVLFDLDGVLLDTESLYTIFWKNAEKKFPTGIDDFAYKIKGSTIKRIFNYFPDTNVQEELLRMINEYEENMKYEIFPGVITFLESLKKSGIPMAIVTSSDKTKMQKLFCQHPDFDKYFNVIITGDMVSKSKPHPECFLLGAKSIGINPEDCYIFEDSPSGLQAALATGAKVIALATTLRRSDINPDSHKIIDGFENFDIKEMLEI